MKLLTIIGFIKAAMVSRAIIAHNNARHLSPVTCHTKSQILAGIGALVVKDDVGRYVVRFYL